MTNQQGLEGILAPEGLYYTLQHEWVRFTGPTAEVGITAYAAGELGYVVFVELPKVGAQIIQFAKLGQVESVKTVADYFSPVSGEVARVNGRLKQEPELVNKEPYGQGWLVKLSIDPIEQQAMVSKLLTADKYITLLSNLQPSH